MLLAIPALCDLITSTLSYLALNFIPGSAYLMMKGGSIASTFLFSKVFLKNKIVRSQIVGSVLAIIGVFVVGVSNVAFEDTSNISDSDAVYSYNKYQIGIINHRLYPHNRFINYQRILLCLWIKTSFQIPPLADLSCRILRCVRTDHGDNPPFNHNLDSLQFRSQCVCL